MKRFGCIVAATSVFLLASPAPLPADTLVHTHSFLLENDATVTLDTFLDLGLLSILDSETSPHEDLVALSFPQFDAGLGLLDSVTFRFITSGAPASLTVSQNNLLTVGVLSGAGVDQTLAVTDTLAGVDLSGTASVLRSQSALLSLGLGAGSAGVSTTGPLLSLNSTFTAPADLASFTGAGTFSLNLSAQMLASLSTVAGLAITGPPSLSGSATYTGSAEVAYNYTPVPEPSAAVMLLIGAFPLTRRKRPRSV
jgi:hypothetical protein